MKNIDSSFRVRYAETDQMGVVHHANYPVYLESARITWLDNLGISYKKLEQDGVMLPVYDLQLTYVKPAFFDDIITVKVSLREAPGVKIIFDYKLYNQHDELLTKAATTLIFVDAKTRKPIRCPKPIFDIIMG
ncbi:acyl-CoA thioester hydrolase [Mesonia hippocampi]|uniref:Acyl-CoA thioester hydrolase n=1 Tax=Mesonia hippocampi TaxID=1628250 RepID=A0A840ENN2_9FLAO|nr:thioesterase family protein [Mesonia hippocampi]MBB4119989.1 acyl-CoA thioester hydrolase [Mesonia hippocampi]